MSKTINLISMNEQDLNDKELGEVLKAESILEEIKEDGNVLLFHSGTADKDDDLKYGVEGGFGEWLEECLSGATDDDELAEEIRNQDGIAFFSEEPSWIQAKIAKKLHIGVGAVSYDQIIEHGQLCILSVDVDDFDFKRAGIRGADNYDGRSHHLNGDFADYNVPFGVEQGDIYSTASINAVEITLTGKGLMVFLDKNFPEYSFKNPKEHVEIKAETNKTTVIKLK